MSETLTMESQPETTTLDNLSAEEQDSLRVGEQIQEAQDNLLAGKYKNAEELEKGYLELQQKLSSQDEPETSTAKKTETETETEETSVNILDTLWEEATSKQEYSKETLDKLESMSTTDLAQLYLDERQKSNEDSTPKNRDFTEKDIADLKGIVGGDENYGNMLTWAQDTLNKEEIDMFDAVMQRGDPLAAFFAIRSLAYAYNDAVGFEGKTLQGKAPRQSNDQFRSQQEVVSAMNDPRYDKDPAFRKEVMDKLERSNINF